jgi:hypothetical protein
MPLPPLSTDERRLGTFALATAVLYTGSGLFFAVFPTWTLRLAALDPHLSMSPGARLWHVLSVSMMAMLALCCWIASRSPRENRRFLLPVILSKAVSTGMAAATLVRWRVYSPEAMAGRHTLWTAIGTDFPLFLATAWFYWKAAPGVNFVAQPQPAAESPQQKPVALGIAKVAAVAEAPSGPAPAATESAKG